MYDNILLTFQLKAWPSNSFPNANDAVQGAGGIEIYNSDCLVIKRKYKQERRHIESTLNIYVSIYVVMFYTLKIQLNDVKVMKILMYDSNLLSIKQKCFLILNIHFIWIFSYTKYIKNYHSRITYRHNNGNQFICKTIIFFCNILWQNP